MTKVFQEGVRIFNSFKTQVGKKGKCHCLIEVKDI